MPAEPQFTCGTCGTSHELPTFSWPYPMPVLYVPVAERPQRVQLRPDDCVIDGQQFFLRACIEIPVHGEVLPFIWGVWAEVSEADYHRYGSSPDTTGEFHGRLPCVPPIYPDSAPEVHIQPRRGLRPALTMVDAAHPIAIHQRDGLSTSQVRKIAEDILHPEHPGFLRRLVLAAVRFFVNPSGRTGEK
jgi:hypothetical protein